MAGDTVITTIGNLTADTAKLAVRVTEFWNHVDASTPDECWRWTGYRDEDGYGRFHWDGQMVGAHELAVTFTTGERRLDGFDTCHSCNNPPCCNPRHLRFDTRRSNVADMLRAGRQSNGPRKLTDDEVRAIRERLKAGARQQDLADQYGVSNSMISMIKTGKGYA